LGFLAGFSMVFKNGRKMDEIFEKKWKFWKKRKNRLFSTFSGFPNKKSTFSKEKFGSFFEILEIFAIFWWCIKKRDFLTFLKVGKTRIFGGFGGVQVAGYWKTRQDFARSSFFHKSGKSWNFHFRVFYAFKK
jgi:hypothetical protein